MVTFVIIIIAGYVRPAVGRGGCRVLNVNVGLNVGPQSLHANWEHFELFHKRREGLAEEAILRCKDTGEWVLLQNCHVLGGWLARLGYNAFNLLLFSVLRPDLKEPYIKLLVETSMEAIELLGVSPSSGGLKDSDLMALFRQEAEKSLTFWGQIRDGMFSLIWVALVALIIAAILQRRSAQQGFSGKA